MSVQYYYIYLCRSKKVPQIYFLEIKMRKLTPLPFISIFSLCLLLPPQVLSLGLVKEIYCGLETCYDILGIPRTEDLKQSTVRKVFREMSQTKHPDKFLSKYNDGEISEEEWAAIQEEFRIITIAYDTLKSKDNRKDYDHYLDHPEDRYYNYYRFYAQKYRVNVDVRLVVIGFLLCWSLFQWVVWNQSYQSALEYRMIFRTLKI